MQHKAHGIVEVENLFPLSANENNKLEDLIELQKKY